MTEQPRTQPPQVDRGASLEAVRRWRDTTATTGGSPADVLGQALTDGAVHVAFQPIVDLDDGRVVAVEALVRLEPPPADELAGAPRLVAVAEDSGLIGVLGTYVLEETCAWLSVWRVAVPDLLVHVNASPTEFQDPGYTSRVLAILAANGLPNGALVIEITETTVLDHNTVSQETMYSLTSAGVVMSLDDFGTGFASLDLLADTPARIVKLDRSFVSALQEDRTVRGRGLIVQATIGMARSLGLELVGEGIETIEQARILRSWGCQLGQGYLFGRPSRGEDLDLRSARFADETMLPVIRSQGLSQDALEVGIGLSRFLIAADPATAVVRADAAAVAVVIASAIGSHRLRTDAAALLATIPDVEALLNGADIDITTVDVEVGELLGALAVTPIISRDTTAGAIARTAWALSVQRARGAPQPDPALLAAHPDPAVDVELRARVADWWATPSVSDPQATAFVLGRGRTSSGSPEEQLRALAGLIRAIGVSGSLEDILEVAADEARKFIGASSLSLGRFEHGETPDDPPIARVLVNLGDLRPGEHRQPANEVYTVADLPAGLSRVLQRTIHVETLGDPAGDPVEQAHLRQRQRGSAAYVPIVVDGEVWGCLQAATALGAPAFTFADGPPLSTVAGFIAVAIRHTEDLTRISRLAGEDQLTGLPNRRALESHLDVLLDNPATRVGLAVALVDVEALHAINDEFGHQTGDEVLIRTAAALSAEIPGFPDALVARISSDEFCVVATLPPDEVAARLERAQQRLLTGPVPQPRLHCGVVAVTDEDTSRKVVVARADAAEHRAIVRGETVVVASDADPTTDSTTVPVRRPAHDRRRHERHPTVSIPRVAALDRWTTQVVADATEAEELLTTLADTVMDILDTASWTLQIHRSDDPEPRLARTSVRRSSVPRDVLSLVHVDAGTRWELTIELDDRSASLRGTRTLIDALHLQATGHHPHLE
ncbi:MAG: EAL domain-containing protein [Nitriliruptoraceae bacterium]